MIAIHFNVKCPYCGWEEQVIKTVVSASPQREVRLCLPDESSSGHDEPLGRLGCGRYFVAEFAVIPTCKTKGIDDDITALT